MKRSLSTAVAVALSAICSSAFAAEETVLFNGRNLEGWSFQVREGEEVQKTMEEVWGVEDGLLVTNNSCTGFLIHEAQFDDFELTMEWRSMRANRNGVTIGAFGSVFVRTGREKGSFHYPKSVEVSLRDVGNVFFRDVDPFSEREWAFRAPEFADDVDNDLGEWNHYRLICRGKKLTVIANGTAVNQVGELTQTKGAVALDSTVGFIQAPTFFRNIVVRPLTQESMKVEESAAKQLAKYRLVAQKEAEAEERERQEEERREKMKEKEFESRWAKIDVKQDLEFSDNVLSLPYPADASEYSFDSTFGDVELRSRMPIAELSRFYRTEMARRGWTEEERERDDESVNVTFKQGAATVELELETDSGEVEIALDCDGLSFAGTDDPAKLAGLGIPQPKAYLFLQKSLKLPDDVFDLEYDSGERCLFKTGMSLQESFDKYSKQIKALGFRESRRPIISGNRRYTEFVKSRVKLSLNVFEHQNGARLIVTYDE